MLRLVAITLLVVAASSPAASPTPEQVAEGWLMLFDGETTFGWKVDGETKIENGTLILGGTKASSIRSTTLFGACELWFEFEPVNDARCWFHGKDRELTTLDAKLHTARFKGEGDDDSNSAELSIQTTGGGAESVSIGSGPIKRSAVGFSVPAGKKLVLHRVWLKPLQLKPIFNGKDLTGWKVFPERKSKFAVTPEGWLNVKDGPGDLATVDQWADFVLQLECISNGDALNSGIFFRCIPNEYQQGYEAQVRNQWVGGDRTKPFDFGTGAIYRRQAARKVVPNDKEWFTMTATAHGNHLATWVNGYPTADFTDDRPESDNARKGTKLGKGTISIQGHDPTTDLSFRNLRIAELPAGK